MKALNPFQQNCFRSARAIFLPLAMAALLGLPGVPSALAEVSAKFQHRLSDFRGPVSITLARIATTPDGNEIYVADPRNALISIFNADGMEVFSFGEEIDLRSAQDLAVDEQGNTYILTNARGEITLCDYRGELLEPITIRELPPEYGDFKPQYIAYRDGALYLADSQNYQVVVLGMEGRYRHGYQLAGLIDADSEELRKGQSGINGFNVDPRGNILFTVSTLFAAFRLSPEGELQSFGKKGSAPGKFGVIKGIAADDHGRIYVADTLRCAVLIFDENFTFLREFGWRGTGPGGLVGPTDLAVSRDRVYVSQVMSQGVSVFRIEPS